MEEKERDNRILIQVLQYAKSAPNINGIIHIDYKTLRCLCGKNTPMVFMTLGKSDIGRFSKFEKGIDLKIDGIQDALNYYLGLISNKNVKGPSFIKRIWNYISTIGY